MTAKQIGAPFNEDYTCQKIGGCHNSWQRTVANSTVSPDDDALLCVSKNPPGRMKHHENFFLGKLH